MGSLEVRVEALEKLYSAGLGSLAEGPEGCAPAKDADKPQTETSRPWWRFWR